MLIFQFRLTTLAGILKTMSNLEEQVKRATFIGIHNLVKELVQRKMDALARKFQETRDMTSKDEIERLATEYGKLQEPWAFVSGAWGPRGCLVLQFFKLAG